MATAILLFMAAGQAASGQAAPDGVTRPGRAVVDVIEELREKGNKIVYSSRLVPRDLTVTVEPESTAPLNALLEILAAHGLTLQPDGDVFVVVSLPGNRRPPKPPRSDSRAPERDEIETITVSASRYRISRDLVTSQFAIDQRTIQNMPDVGEDPIRIAQRLPGAAAGGASARAHFRGGEESEVGIILNGQRLFDPFHIRDYQSVFSAIDARAIQGVEVFTGGFPVRFGDRMSGLVVMESIDTKPTRHTEIGISVFNTSLLHADSGTRSDWLFSARRGNLDLVIDPRYGQPSYYDVFSRYSIDLGRRTTLSLNALYADDVITVVLETDPAEREAASSTTRNAQIWMQVDTDWSSRLSSRSAFSFTDYRNRRDGTLGDSQKLVATVRDNRDVRQAGFRQDWSYRASDAHSMQWGFGVVNSRADYDYAGEASYFGLPALYRGQPASLSRALTAKPSGGSYSLYLADRWKLSTEVSFEWGLRWDDQTYTGLSSDSQLSPRLSLLYLPRQETELRVSWGLYQQSQGIHELQVEDGLSTFWPAQRADHLIAGLKHRFNAELSLRVEAFYKKMRNVRPRFENLYDPLALIPELQADRVLLAPSSARAQGLEVSIEGDRDNWSWWASYTLSNVTDRIEGRNERRSWDQRHAFQAGVSWTTPTWSLSLAAGAHTGWPTTGLSLVEDGVDADGEPVLVAVPGPRNVLRHGDFMSIDARASRRFDVRRGSLTAFVEVSNLTNRRNVCCSDWDIEEDDAGNVALENSRDFWLPLLPAVGILWEF